MFVNKTFYKKRAIVSQRPPLQQSNIVQKVMQYLKVMEVFQIASVSKLFQNLSQKKNSFGEHIFIFHWTRETVPPSYRALGFESNDFENTWVQIKNQKKYLTGILKNCYRDMSQRSRSILHNLCVQCQIIPFFGQKFDPICFSLPNLKSARIEKHPVSLLGSQNLKLIQSLKLFNCCHENLTNIFFEKLTILEFTHYSYRVNPATVKDIDQFCTAVSSENLPSLKTITIGCKTKQICDLSFINKFPQVQTLHLQDDAKLVPIFSHVKCLIISHKGHFKPMSVRVITAPTPSTDFHENKILDHFPNLKYFYTDRVMINAKNNIPQNIIVKDLSDVKLSELYEKTY